MTKHSMNFALIWISVVLPAVFRHVHKIAKKAGILALSVYLSVHHLHGTVWLPLEGVL